MERLMSSCSIEESRICAEDWERVVGLSLNIRRIRLTLLVRTVDCIYSVQNYIYTYDYANSMTVTSYLSVTMFETVRVRVFRRERKLWCNFHSRCLREYASVSQISWTFNVTLMVLRQQMWVWVSSFTMRPILELITVYYTWWIIIYISHLKVGSCVLLMHGEWGRA